jgi:hypothetical protein
VKLGGRVVLMWRPILEKPAVANFRRMIAGNIDFDGAGKITATTLKRLGLKPDKAYEFDLDLGDGKSIQVLRKPTK